MHEHVHDSTPCGTLVLLRAHDEYGGRPRIRRSGSTACFGLAARSSCVADWAEPRKVHRGLRRAAGRQRSVAKSHTNATQGTQPYARSHGCTRVPLGGFREPCRTMESAAIVSSSAISSGLSRSAARSCAACAAVRTQPQRPPTPALAKWRTTCNMHKPNDRRRATRSRSSCSLRASARAALRPYESVRPNRRPPAQSASHSALVPIAMPTWTSSAPDRKRVRRAAMPACDGSSVMTPPSTAASAATSSSLGCSICGGRS